MTEYSEKNRVLIVDDEKANLLVLNSILGADYTLFMARDGQEAIDRANENPPDLILLDILMPGLDGYETLAELKKSEKTRDIPVIFITGLSSSEDEMKGLSLGADDYIAKPFHEAIVLLRIRNQLKIVNQMRIIEKMSMTDKLTDMPNRRSFDRQLNMEWKRAARDKSPISILMIDIDHFKSFNDTYGHQQGDAALKTVAMVLAQSLKRPGDFLARWGGEEFAILLPSTDMPGALTVGEQLRLNIENTPIPRPDGPDADLTVSVGANAHEPAHDDLVEDFIKKADEALYTAKKEGRNRVCKWEAATKD